MRIVTGKNHDEATEPHRVPATDHPTPSAVDTALGVYSIAVAAELVGTPAQSLRLYETRGLLRPDRTTGGTRRYSSNDLDRLRRISDLQNEGLNLAGIAMVLDLQDENSELRDNPPISSTNDLTQGRDRSERHPGTA